MKIIIGLVITFLSFVISAEPAPFGLIINKTTTDELNSKYNAQLLGSNKTNELRAYELSPRELNFSGLLSAKAAFSNDNLLKLVQVSLPSSKFDEIFASFKSKYNFLYKNTPMGGNKEAKFEQDNTYIVLFAAQNSEEMDILYINKALLEETIKPIAINNLGNNNEIGML